MRIIKLIGVILFFVCGIMWSYLMATDLQNDSLSALRLQDSLSVQLQQKHADSLLLQSQNQKNLFANWRISNINWIQNSATVNAEPSIQKLNTKIFEDALFYIIIALLLFLTVLKTQYQKEFNDLFSVFGSIGRNQILFRSKTGSVPWISVLLNIFSIIIFSIYLWLLINHFQLINNISAQKLILIIGITITSAILIKYFSVLLSSILFYEVKELKFYSFYEMQLVRFTGIILFPVVIILAFANPVILKIMFPVSWIIILLFFLFRIFRGFQIGGNYLSKSKFHFIIYICALEIAPFLIIIKFVFTRFNF